MRDLRACLLGLHLPGGQKERTQQSKPAAQLLPLIDSCPQWALGWGDIFLVLSLPYAHCVLGAVLGAGHSRDPDTLVGETDNSK